MNISIRKDDDIGCTNTEYATNKGERYPGLMQPGYRVLIAIFCGSVVTETMSVTTRCSPLG